MMLSSALGFFLTQ